jgi:hypothetical protein
MSDARGSERRPLRLLSLGTIYVLRLGLLTHSVTDGGGIRGYSEYATAL